MKVFVGLSGGVDSAVSAALLQSQGHEVVGAFIRIAIEGYPCTAGEDRISAMRVAAHLKIPFVEVDLSKEYQERVFTESIRGFSQGNTPNPDILCNREIKFGLFYEWARAQGADWVATGHYARVSSGELLVGVDKEKDQSYFLWAVPGAILKHVLFPIGHLTKPQVRKLATKLGLPNAARRDSQGLCFLGPLSVSAMLQKELHPAPGAVLDESGQEVGVHEGALLYTLGQRHGFSFHSQSPAAAPHYVIAKDIAANTITVSTDKFPTAATATEVLLADTNWIGSVESGPCLARYRYRQELIPAVLQRSDLGEDFKGLTFAKVMLLKPHWVPKGQSLVVYKQERCLGGGVIQESTVY